MGYMGFGMRKEVYTRKPKEAFKKLKSTYGKALKFPKSKKPSIKEVSTSFEKHSYKPFFLSTPYKIFKLLLALFIIGWAIWSIFLKDPYFQYQRNQFEEHEFVGYYQSQMPEYQRTFDFIRQRTDKIVRIGYTGRYESYDFYIRSAKIDTLHPYDVGFKSFDGIEKLTRVVNRDEIVNGTLTVHRNGYVIKTYQHSWEYGMRSIVFNQIPTSFIEYLESDQDDLANFLRDIKSIRETVRVSRDSIYVNYDNPRFGRYTLIFSNKAPEPSSKLKEGYWYNVVVGQLDENIYWLRRERVRNS